MSFLKEHGKIISREELDTILSKEKTEVIEAPDIDEAMAQAVDISENDDEGEDSEAEVDEQQGEKITRNWSVLKSTPQLTKTKVLEFGCRAATWQGRRRTSPEAL